MSTTAAPSFRGHPGLKFGFSTLGCPELDLHGLRILATAHQIPFVEIRALGGSLDFVAQLGRFPGGATAARDFLSAANVHVPLVASSFLLTCSPEAQRATLQAEAETGEALGAKWLRVFGGVEWGDPLTPQAATTARAHRAWWQQLRAARGWNIDLILEVHDAFSGSREILALFEQTDGPMPLLWDTHITWKTAGEDLAYSWSRLGSHVRHVHLRDSISRPSDKMDHTYVAPGQGEFPLQTALALLAVAHFDGIVSFEWERQWHPSLAPLDAVLPSWNAVTAAYRRA